MGEVEAQSGATRGRRVDAAGGLASGRQDGPLKAALWLLSVDEATAIAVIGRLDEPELLRLREGAAQVRTAAPEEIQAIHQELQIQAQRGGPRLKGGIDYLTMLLTRAVGEERASRVLVGPEVERQRGGLARADSDALAAALAEEHPQLVAAVLASLPPKRSAELLGKLGKEMAAEVMRRFAELEAVPAEALALVEGTLAAGLPVADERERQLDGARGAALLLNQLPEADANALLEGLSTERAEIATKIRRAMFRFDDLARLDRKSFQMLLKEIPSDQLLLALKTASPEIKNKVFAGLSRRAAEMLKDDLQMMGPARLADVEAAQQTVVDAAIQLKNDGKIMLAGAGGEGFV